jgi:hypothetical protein
MKFLCSSGLVLITAFLVVTVPVRVQCAEPVPGNIVLKHLDSLGSAAARAAVNSRVVEGAATYRVLVGGSGAIDGKSVLATENHKTNLLLKINANGFHGEQFICDGDKISVAGTYSDKTRAEFGEFVLAQNATLRENLLGGVWSAGWPLLDLEGRKARVHAEGLRKVDGRDLIVLGYQPKKGTDLQISLFFEPVTYRHVMTTYKISRGPGIGASLVDTARKQAARFEIQERFSEFKSIDSLVLPTRYDLRYTEEQDNGFTKTVEWEVRAVKIVNNLSIDARSFEVK